jgi:hypothetical protein
LKKTKVKFNSKKPRKKVKKIIIVGITILTFFTSLVFSLISNILSENMDVISATLVVVTIILIGIMFDMLGVAVATADETPFHSMASSKVRGSKESLFIIRRAGIFSTIFNDVIGDVAGIVSGAATAGIVAKLILTYNVNGLVASIILSSMVAALTVGGKAIAKTIAMNNSNEIVYKIGYTFSSKGKN